MLKILILMWQITKINIAHSCTCTIENSSSRAVKGYNVSMLHEWASDYLRTYVQYQWLSLMMKVQL